MLLHHFIISLCVRNTNIMIFKNIIQFCKKIKLKKNALFFVFSIFNIILTNQIITKEKSIVYR